MSPGRLPFSQPLLLALVLAGCLLGATAHAIPPFARKYATGCQTCHTVYPRLNPFGEAFRRRGYRFPGVDSDAMKQENIALGQEAYKQVFPQAVWPGLLPATLPLGAGASGQAVMHPDLTSSAARADHGSLFSLQGLVGEVRLWAGGSFDDAITFIADVGVDSHGTVDVAAAAVHVNDLLGPTTPVNLVVGQAVANLTSFSVHSSYVADALLPPVATAALYGATTNGFQLQAPAPGLELNGVLAEHLTWALGLSAGSTVGLRPTGNAWAHVGTLWGNTEAPGFWHDASVTADLFGYRASSRFLSASGALTADTALVLGGAVRVAVKGLELDVGAYAQGHDHAQADNDGVAPGQAGALVVVQYDELSWQLFPWLVPAVRVEYLRATTPAGAAAWSLRVMPGVAVLFRQNLKAVLTAQFETAAGVLPGGWAGAGGWAQPTTEQPTVKFEAEAVVLSLAAAF